MGIKNSENAKNISVTLDKSITRVPTYDLFLIRGDSEHMEVQLASKTETDTEIKVLVEYIFRINKDIVPQFARQFAKYLQEFLDKQEEEE